VSEASDLEKLEVLYEEWARGDYSRSDIFHADMRVESFGMGEPIEAESYDGFVAVMRNWLAAWERPIRIYADEFIPNGNMILVFVRWSGRGKGSGAQIEAEGAHLWTFTDGLVSHFGVYRDRDEARAALEQA
jgi:ketosteroid isomerase-like protein